MRYERKQAKEAERVRGKRARRAVRDRSQRQQAGAKQEDERSLSPRQVWVVVGGRCRRQVWWRGCVERMYVVRMRRRCAACGMLPPAVEVVKEADRR